MKILLIYPPCCFLFWGYKNQGQSAPPLGLPYLAAYLKREGYEVSALDLNIKMYFAVKEEDKRLWHKENCKFWTIKELFLDNVLPKMQDIQERWIDSILKLEPRIIGLYVSSTSRWMALSLARRLKEKDNDIVIIFGGPECHREGAEEFLKTGYVDVVVMGEGEVTLLEIVNSYEKTGQIKPCPGAFFRENGEIIYSGQRELIEDLDNLAYPDFSDLIDDHKILFGDSLWLSISWLRGCRHHCAFCYDNKFWRYARPRSPESICQELIFQKQKYNVKGFNKNDPLLAFSEELLSKTCDLLIEKKVDVLWGSQARPEKYMTLELLQKLYKAGCRYLCYGLESGSQAVIDRMNKGFQVKTAQDIIINTRRTGILAKLFIMVGSPGETLIDFIKTVWFIVKNRKFIDDISITSAGIVYMSDWYLRPEKYGIVIKKKRYDFWRTKYYINNHYTRTIKRFFLEGIYYAIKTISRILL